MGIITDPGYELTGNDCLHGFPAGETPKKLYASIQGVTGPYNPGPGALPPVNGIWLMEQTVDNCVWLYNSATYFAQLTITAIDSQVIAGQDYPDGKHFQDFPAGNQRFFINDYQAAGMWRGGHCWISPRPNFGPNPTIKGVMGLLNIAPAKKTFAETFPVPDGKSVFKFNRKSDKTNVKIKVDPAIY